MVDVYRAERNLSKMPFMLGSGYASVFDTLLIFRKKLFLDKIYIFRSVFSPLLTDLTTH